jgi:hypothetical protein
MRVENGVRIVVAVSAMASLMVAVGMWAILGTQTERGRGQSSLDEASRLVATAMARTPGSERPVAVINGEPVNPAGVRLVLALQQFNAAQGIPTATPQQVVDTFVERKLLLQEARRRGLECDDQETREFIESWKEHTTPEGQQATAETYGVPVDRLEAEPRFLAAARNFCTLGAVRRAIAADNPEVPLEEAVDRAVAELRAKAEITLDPHAIQAIATEASSGE